MFLWVVVKSLSKGSLKGVAPGVDILPGVAADPGSSNTGGLSWFDDAPGDRGSLCLCGLTRIPPGLTPAGLCPVWWVRFLSLLLMICRTMS